MALAVHVREVNALKWVSAARGTEDLRYAGCGVNGWGPKG